MKRQTALLPPGGPPARPRATRGTGGAGGRAGPAGLRPGDDAAGRVLVLGSMPGTISLRQGRYYAHPRNAFWPIAAEILGFDPALDYALRLERLTQAGVALWDVLQGCEREGSLDADIRNAVPNDFAGFLRAHPQLRRVCLNGGKAASLFRRQVLPSLPAALADPLVCLDLPSTSPAHAAISYEQKLAAWRSGEPARRAGLSAHARCLSGRRMPPPAAVCRLWPSDVIRRPPPGIRARPCASRVAGP